jgi:hypothetical protein
VFTLSSTAGIVVPMRGILFVSFLPEGSSKASAIARDRSVPYGLTVFDPFCPVKRLLFSVVWKKKTGILRFSG